MAAPVYASSTNTTYASRANTSVNKPSGTVEGDLVLIWILLGLASPPALTPPSGFSLLPEGTWPIVNSGTSFSMKTYCYYKVAGGSEPTSYAFTHTTCSSQAVSIRVTGAGASPSFKVSTNGGTEAMSTFVGVTPSKAESLIVLLEHDWGDKTNTLSVPSGSTPTFTKRIETNPLVFTASGTLSKAEPTGNKTMTNNNAATTQSFWATAMVAVEPPSGEGKAWKVEVSDTVTGTDALVKGTAKAVADSVTGSDSVTKSVAKPFTDSVTAADAVGKSPSIVLADSVAAADALTKQTTKGLSDTASGSDAISKGMLKALTDSVTAADAVAKQPRKAFADTVTGSDGIAKAVAKAVSDAVTGVESLAKMPMRALLDVVTGSDSFVARIIEHIVPLEQRPTKLYLRDSGSALSLANSAARVALDGPQAGVEVGSSLTTLTVGRSPAKLDFADPDAALQLQDREAEVKLDG